MQTTTLLGLVLHQLLLSYVQPHLWKLVSALCCFLMSWEALLCLSLKRCALWPIGLVWYAQDVISVTKIPDGHYLELTTTSCQ